MNRVFAEPMGALRRSDAQTALSVLRTHGYRNNLRFPDHPPLGEFAPCYNNTKGERAKAEANPPPHVECYKIH